MALLMLLGACRKDVHPHTAHQQLTDANAPPPPQVDLAAPTLYNALDDKTRATLHVTVVVAKLTQGYTWLHVKDDSGSGWVAGPMLRVPPQSIVEIRDYVPSQEIDPDVVPGHVPKVLFAAVVQGPDVVLLPVGDEAAVHPLLPAGGVTATDLELELPAMEKADHDIAELYIRSGELEGKTIAVRGQVVRVSPSIGGRNFIFLRDGRGDTRTGILPASIAVPVQAGDVVTVVGRLLVHRRFPYGGTHALLLADGMLAENPEQVQEYRTVIDNLPATATLTEEVIEPRGLDLGAAATADSQAP